MVEVLLKNAVVREAGYLYYIDKTGSVCRTKMARGGRSAKIQEVKMDKLTYEQLDRIEFMLTKIAEKVCPDIFERETGGKNEKR